MIKPIKISALNTTFELLYKCTYCKEEGVIKLTNKLIHTDNLGNAKEELDYECPKCRKLLNNDSKTASK